MRWNPDRSTLFAVAGTVSPLIWLVGTIAGKHPDGGLLGFSAGMWAVWSALDRTTQRREQREQRDDGEDEQPPHPHRRPPPEPPPPEYTADDDDVNVTDGRG